MEDRESEKQHPADIIYTSDSCFVSIFSRWLFWTEQHQSSCKGAKGWQLSPWIEFGRIQTGPRVYLKSGTQLLTEQKRGACCSYSFLMQVKRCSNKSVDLKRLPPSPFVSFSNPICCLGGRGLGGAVKLFKQPVNNCTSCCPGLRNR